MREETAQDILEFFLLLLGFFSVETETENISW